MSVAAKKRAELMMDCLENTLGQILMDSLYSTPTFPNRRRAGSANAKLNEVSEESWHTYLMFDHLSLQLLE